MGQNSVGDLALPVEVRVRSLVAVLSRRENKEKREGPYLVWVFLSHPHALLFQRMGDVHFLTFTGQTK